MSDIFSVKKIDCNLRFQTGFKQGPINLLNYDLKSLLYLALRRWNIIPFKIRNASSLTVFVTNKSILEYFPCTLCRKYIHQLSYTDYDKIE